MMTILTIVTIAFVGIGALGTLLLLRRPSQSARAGSAPALLACPACGTFNDGAAEPGRIVRCSDCGAYTLVDDSRTLVAVPQDHAADYPVFQAYLPEEPCWPAVCCVCGAAPTHAEKLSITYEAEPDFAERMTANAVVGLAS